MTINLRAITRNNYREILALRVTPEQQKYVAPNVLTIAQMQFKEEKIVLGIYTSNTTPVGLIAYDLDDYDIWRLMVDYRYQKRGYGRQAMKKVIEILRNHGKLSEVKTSVVSENKEVIMLYKSLGFHENGELHGEEIVLTRPI
ncbi:MAG: GNAT family N-acetyltransferase [Candidatus Hodarchaeales archaeon]|jgi:diamine N-acetyltransferase